MAHPTTRRSRPTSAAVSEARGLPRRGAAICGLIAWSLLAAATSLPAEEPVPATRLEDLIARFQAMPGFSARFEEEKSIALLSLPLRSEGSIYFAPPQLLLRRVETPAPSVLKLDGEQLRYTDASGTERFDLGANPTARIFAHTFTDVLAGDLPRLRATYDIGFEPERARSATAAATSDTAWRLDLTPRDEGLARAIERLTVRGHGLVLIDLVVREASGDSTLTRFSDVDPRRRFEASEIARLAGPIVP